MNIPLKNVNRSSPTSGTKDPSPGNSNIKIGIGPTDIREFKFNVSAEYRAQPTKLPYELGLDAHVEREYYACCMFQDDPILHCCSLRRRPTFARTAAPLRRMSITLKVGKRRTSRDLLHRREVNQPEVDQHVNEATIREKTPTYKH